MLAISSIAFVSFALYSEHVAEAHENTVTIDDPPNTHPAYLFNVDGASYCLTYIPRLSLTEVTTCDLSAFGVIDLGNDSAKIQLVFLLSDEGFRRWISPIF